MCRVLLLMCRVFTLKAAWRFKPCTLYAYKITKKELHYTYFEVFFIAHLVFFICGTYNYQVD